MALFDFSPLFEYFAIIGYNPACGLRQEKITKFDEGITVQKSPLEAIYESKIIAHFPKERPNKPFAPEIALLALPTGVHLYTEQNLPSNPSFHSFVLIREDGTRLYGCSLIFYEELRSNDLRQQIFDAQLTYLHEFASSPSTSSKNYITEKTKRNCNYATQSLPRKLSISKRGDDLSNKYSKNDEEHIAYYKNPNSPLFISKCIAVMTAIPIIYSSENFLHNLWMLINDKLPKERLTFEEILQWALHQIPLPPLGASIKIAHPNFHMLVRRPAQDALPFFDYPIQTLFNYISVDKFLKLFTCFMLEKQILIISKNALTLMLVAECLSILVFPFSWQMTYCPILPHSQFEFLESPFPWLMGLCLENRTFPDEIAQSNICYLNIDSHCFEMPEDLPPFPRLQQITDQIQFLVRKFSSPIKTNAAVHSFYQKGLQFNDAIRSIFFDHFVTLFSTYENYLLNAGNDVEKSNFKRRRNARIMRESTANFDKISFFADQPGSVLPFLSAFLETQMFTSFIDSKIILTQNSSLHALNVQIFDQKIALNSNQKNPITVEHEFASDICVKSREMDTEFHISLPTPQNNGTYKYNGFVPNPDASSLECVEKFPPKIVETSSKLQKSCVGFDMGKIDSNEPKQMLIMRKNKCEIDKNEEEQNSINSAPMNLAHQNWKFVEQLLKEAKTKTKRILVAKMGKEAIHLGHGQLHLGISGVEENTMVAAFCDLLERIWSHGLRKKQGKSALWAYIIAFHEWEKRNNLNISNRSNSVDVDKSSSPESRTCITSEDNTDSPLFELISSIRKIAGTLDLPRSRDNSPCNSDPNFNSISNNNNWSQSLLRAANVICEKITATTTNASSLSNTDNLTTNEKNGQNIMKMNNATGLPPRPPLLSNSQKQRFFTPQIRRKMIDETNFSIKIDENGMDAKDTKNKTGTGYQKFICKTPLKVLNDQERLERRGRDSNRSNRIQRSLSSQPQNNFMDLASRISEDSLSRMTLSTANTETETPLKRRPRDLSNGFHHNAASFERPRNGRSLSRSRGSSPSRFYERLSRGGTVPEFYTFAPLPNSMAYDLKNIIKMTEIKTDIGFARAFVRLALERKQLYNYLKKLLSNTQLLQKNYKRYSFLRCDDEREQFLFHLLSLNAVDFFCFTNTFLTIKMRYQVMLIGSLDRFSDSLVYIVLTGSLGCTSSIFLPANSTQFTFDFKNLGILSTLRIGHSAKNTQRLTKWYLDYVLVRNCITAQTFYFQCARWFGRGIEDGALERLLVAEAIVSRSFEQEDKNDNNNKSTTSSLNSFQSPVSNAPAFLSPRKSKYDMNSATIGSQKHRKWRSPSSDRKISDCEIQSGGRSVIEATSALDQLQSLEHRTGVAINAMMKHFLSSTEQDQQTSNAKLSTLLCAEDGLLPCIDEIFAHGLIQRIFQRVYPWDYVVKVFGWFNQFFRNGESKKLTREQRSLIIYTYKMVERIGEHTAVGKEERFHLFVLLSLRDHIFSGLIPLIAWTPVTAQLYDKDAFIRLPSKLSYFAKLVGSLNEFYFEYEKSLIHGMT